MDWQLTPYTIGLALTTLLSLSVAVVAMRHRHRPGSVVLALAMLAGAEWAFCYVFEANAVTLEQKLFWSQAAYVGIVATTPLFLHFAIAFTDPDRRLRPIVLGLIWGIPGVTLGLALTNRQHGLIWSDLTFTDATQRTLIYGHGEWFWVLVVHNYVLIAIATLLFARAAIRHRHLYRQQSILTLASVIPPWIVHILYIASPDLLGSQDWTPTAFAITGLLAMWGLSEMYLLDLVPVARDRVVESIEDGVIVIDGRGRIVDLNPAARRWLDAHAPDEHMSSRDAVGKPVAEVSTAWIGSPLGFLPDPRTPEEIWANGPTEGEILADNRVLAWRLTPLQKQRRGHPGYLLLMHDVTEQKAAQAALEAVNATLEIQVAERTAEIRAEKERSEAILSSVSDGIVMTDRDLFIVYANPGFTELTGYSVEEALGCPVDEVVGLEVRRLMAMARATPEPWHGEARAPRKDGRLFDVALTIAPVRGPGDAVSGYVATLRDISPAKALDRARKGFIDNISHQLRTPVTTLKLYAHLMAQTELTEQNRRSLDVIRKQVAWLDHLIQDILEITTLDSGKALTTWVPFELTTLADHFMTRYRERAASLGLELVLAPMSGDPPQVMGDAARLTEALSKLVDNALQFTRAPGTVTLAIERTERAGHRWATIAVRDTGPGIPPQEQPRVFERFFRGSAAEDIQIAGTGLGLSIAQTIVEAHGGEITLQSDGGGTTFTVWLPTIERATDPA